MTETITILRHRISAQDVVDVFLDDVRAEAILTYLVDKDGNRQPFEISMIEIDIINPKSAVATTSTDAAEQPEPVVSDERKEELDTEVDPDDEDDSNIDGMAAAGESDAQDDDQDAGTVAEDSDPAREDEASDEGSIGKRYFYNADDDKLIVTDDGSTPSVMDDEDTAGDWSELDASEGEEIEAELAKQGDLLGGDENHHAEKRPQEAKEERREDEVSKEPEKGAATKGGKLAQRAGILSNEKGFWKFLGSGGDAVTSAEQAAQAIRDVCRVKSRADIDGDPEATRAFKSMDRSYQAWLKD